MPTQGPTSSSKNNRPPTVPNPNDTLLSACAPCMINRAISTTSSASSADADRRYCVEYHTQSSRRRLCGVLPEQPRRARRDGSRARKRCDKLWRWYSAERRTRVGDISIAPALLRQCTYRPPQVTRPGCNPGAQVCPRSQFRTSFRGYGRHQLGDAIVQCVTVSESGVHVRSSLHRSAFCRASSTSRNA